MLIGSSRRCTRRLVLFAQVTCAGVLTWLAAAGQAGAIEASLLERSRSSISYDELHRHVGVLADDTFEGREAGSRGGHAAGGYLKEYLQEQGLVGGAEDGSFYQVFGEGYRNILAILPGSDEALRDEYVLIGAHYDHVGYGTARNSYGPTGYIHNGADDNASGVSVLLEVVDAMTNHGPQPRRSVIFALWDGEEKGLLGSKHWTEHPTLPVEQIALAMNMDMVGRLRPQGCDIFGTRSAAGLRRLVAQQNRQVDLSLNFTWEVKDNSDHHPFFAKDVPVLMFHTGLHDDYHRPRDDAEKLNYEGMEQVSQLVLSVVYEAADVDSLPAFRPAARQEGKAAQRSFSAPLPASPPRLGILWVPQEEGEGIRITRVMTGTPGHLGGLRRGDRLLSLAGEPLGDRERFRQLVQLSHGEVPAVVQRRGEEEPLTLTLPMPAQPVRWGIAWHNNDGEPGIVTLVRVTPGTAAAASDLQVGDRIYEVNGLPFDDPAAFSELTRSLEGPVELLIERHGRLIPVRIELPPRSTDLHDVAVTTAA